MNAIAMEQQFLHEIQKSHVYRVLQEYRNDYKESFINISQVILRHIIGNMLLQKIGTYNKENAYEALFHYIWNRDIDELEQEINLCLQVLMKQQCNEQNTLSQGKFYQYFQNDVHGFTLQLKTINEIKNMRNVVIL